MVGGGGVTAWLTLHKEPQMEPQMRMMLARKKALFLICSAPLNIREASVMLPAYPTSSCTTVLTQQPCRYALPMLYLLQVNGKSLHRNFYDQKLTNSPRRRVSNRIHESIRSDTKFHAICSLLWKKGRMRTRHTRRTLYFFTLLRNRKTGHIWRTLLAAWMRHKHAPITTRSG